MHNLLLYYTRFFFGHSACTTCNLRNQCGITISSANQDLDCLDTRLPALLAQVPRDITRRVDRVIWKLLVIAVTLFMLMCVQLWSVAASRVTGTTPKHPRTGSPHRSPKGEFAVFSLQPWGWNQLFKQVYQSVKNDFEPEQFPKRIQDRVETSWNHSFGFSSAPSVGFGGCILIYYKHGV